MRTKRRKEEDTRCRWKKKKKKKKKTSHPVSPVSKKGSSQETAEKARSCEELLLSLNTDWNVFLVCLLVVKAEGRRRRMSTTQAPVRQGERFCFPRGSRRRSRNSFTSLQTQKFLTKKKKSSSNNNKKQCGRPHTRKHTHNRKAASKRRGREKQHQQLREEEEDKKGKGAGKRRHANLLL